MAYKVEVAGGQTKYLPNVKAPAKSRDPAFIKVPMADFLLLETNEEQLVRVAEKLEVIVVEAPHLQGLEVDVAVERLVGAWREANLLLHAREREVGLVRVELRAALERVDQLRREHGAALEQIERMRGKDLRRPSSEIPTLQAPANVPDVGAINSSTEQLLGAMQEFIRQIQSRPPEVAHSAGGNGKIDP